MIRLISFFILATPLFSRAHPVSLSWAHARISENTITINFRIFAEDLVYFHHPQPDEYYNYDPSVLRSLAVRHSELVREYFFITDNEDRLKSEIVSINDQSLNQEEKINVMDLMKYEIQFKIEYTLNDTNWKRLFVYQEFGRHGIGIPSVTFLSVYANNVALVENVEVSPGHPFTLKPEPNQLNQNPSELTSSFFTISPFGVRHELTLPSSVFQNFIYQPSPDKSPFVQTTNYFKTNNLVFGNSLKLDPELKQIKTLEMNDEDSLSIIDGFIYLDIFYPADQPLNHSKITWTDYNWKFRWFDAEIMGMDSTYHYTFSRFRTDFNWKPKKQNLRIEN